MRVPLVKPGSKAVTGMSQYISTKILDDVLGPKVYDPRIRPAGENSTGDY